MMSEEIAKFEKRNPKFGQKCAGKNCEKILNTNTTGRNTTKNGEMCDDCYYDQLGEVIERHPIVSPRIIR